MVRASLNISARVAKSSIYFCEKEGVYCLSVYTVLTDNPMIHIHKRLKMVRSPTNRGSHKQRSSHLILSPNSFG